MPDLLREASAWLAEMMKRHVSQPVVYCRSGQSFSIDATIGKTIFQISRDSSFFEKSESRDFIVAANDLLMGAEIITPKRGDRIKERDKGKIFIYEVMAPGNEPPWRWSDQYRISMRVHTKLVATEDIP